MTRKAAANSMIKIETNPTTPRFELITVKPMTKNQSLFASTYHENLVSVAAGSAGTGKTFLAIALALKEIQDSPIYKRIVIVRSCVPTRDLGALPGDLEEKTDVYELPYKAIATELYKGYKNAYNRLKEDKKLEFMSTSYIRGVTIHNAIVIVDEFQNCGYGELSTLITRPGPDCKIVFCGDFKQSDFTNEREKQGAKDFLKILGRMPSAGRVDFTLKDVVRSGICKEFLIAEEEEE